MNDSLSERENPLLVDHDPDTAHDPETDSQPESVSSKEDDREQSRSSNRKLTPKQARPKKISEASCETYL